MELGAPCALLYTHWLRPRNPPPPLSRIWAHMRGRYWSAKIDDRSLCDPLPASYRTVES
jgi:hypothetical protein